MTTAPDHVTITLQRPAAEALLKLSDKNAREAAEHAVVIRAALMAALLLTPRTEAGR